MAPGMIRFAIRRGLAALLLSIACATCASESLTPSVPSATPVGIATPQAPESVAATEPKATVSQGTPGKILCAKVVCDLKKEVCCVNEENGEGRCAARDGFNGCGQSEAAKHCDESADCGAGAVCCKTWACTGGCPMEYQCESKSCAFDPDNEICVAGGGCSKGRSCQVMEGRAGVCLAPKKPLDCAGKPCTADCCWNTKTLTADCKTQCPTDDLNQHMVFTCMGPADCPGGVCGNVSPMPLLRCMGASLASDRAGWVICNSVKDCPKHWGSEATACKKNDSFPPGLKTCEW